jgi:hypothetical protein
MRKYLAEDERKIRIERHVREWFRSGLIDKAQHDRILPELRVDLRRTNLFLRMLLSAFGILIIVAAVLLGTIGATVDWITTTGVVCLLMATACFFGAEFLVSRFRLYRFGVEEGAAVSSVALAVIAGMLVTSRTYIDRPRESGAFWGLLVGSMLALLIYRRFGYVYAAIASMLCISLVPFTVDIPETAQRLVSSALLVVIFVVARSMRLKAGRDFPSGEYSAIQSAALIGLYAFLNLKLSSVDTFFRAPAAFPQSFYWFTYIVIWFLPAIGLYLGLRDRDRAVIDVSAVLALATLMTNKPYLNLPRQTWDPILLGVLLIGLAVVLRKWLSSGDRSGFTASRILTSDKSRLAMVATASAAMQTSMQTPAATAPSRNIEPGGGRSGGGGASASF